MLLLIADRNDEVAARFQLIEQHFWNGGCTGCNNDLIERGFIHPTPGTIPNSELKKILMELAIMDNSNDNTSRSEINFKTGSR